MKKKNSDHTLFHHTSYDPTNVRVVTVTCDKNVRIIAKLSITVN